MARRRRRKPYRGPTLLTDLRKTYYWGRNLKIQFELRRGAMRRLALSDELRDACRAVIVGQALPYAIRVSPRDRVNDGDGTLPYVASWRVAEGTDVFVGMRRTTVKLINVAPHAAAVEWINPDTGRGHGYHVLGRTLAHLDGQTGTEIRGTPQRPAWKAAQHPRGPGGRFVAKTPTATTADPAGGDAAAVGNAVYDALRRRRR
ncbi:hypothetical protein [Actinoplanes derwentensis]|uniref:Uncharacterized protein n=1 Tax=Actinoplanes derwentensis TaxID=113562 RepID=A0A1H2CUZ3_9ACTN|nr:hypothetical protein [Actinoplanes derwentensis]GID82015.1 hypothetical protein Ade03nite_09390 [Actinoplanes derwentensis]SDT74370.1 hypothetical protein SAMN04489716_6961 [Actinoplanes derwentensis]